MMDATYLSHEIFGSHHAAPYCDSISHFNHLSIAPAMVGPTIAGKTPNDSLNGMGNCKIPLHAVLLMQAGGVDGLLDTMARYKAATVRAKEEGHLC